jgi:hypothetical protein
MLRGLFYGALPSERADSIPEDGHVKSFVRAHLNGIAGLRTIARARHPGYTAAVMRLVRWLAIVGVACGGAPAPDTTTRPRSDDRSGREEAQRARDAFERGDLEIAGGLIEEALAADPTDETVLAEFAAIELARGHDQRVAEALADATHRDLVLLRAKARFRLGDARGVVRDLESFADEERDGWMEVALAIARGAGDGAWWVAGGADRASLPTLSGPPVPVIEIAIDGEPVRALVSTATDLTVIDDRLAEEASLVERIELGPVTLGRVPALVRDLDPLERQLGTPIGAVIGLDVLRHFETTIDYAQHRVVLRREGTEVGQESSNARYATLAGSFLSVHAIMGEVQGWLVIDTGGLFPIALSPNAVAALGLDLETLEAPPSAPAPDVRLTQIESLRVSDFELRGVPAVTGLVPRDLDALSGVALAGMLGAVTFNERKLVIAPASRRIHVE